MSQHPPHGSLPPGWESPHKMLELSRYCLKCDEPGCTATSPQSDAVNFETGGVKQACALAEQNGWSTGVRVSCGVRRDFCPVHKPRSAR